MCRTQAIAKCLARMGLEDLVAETFPYLVQVLTINEAVRRLSSAAVPPKGASAVAPGYPKQVVVPTLWSTILVAVVGHMISEVKPGKQEAISSVIRRKHGSMCQRV